MRRTAALIVLLVLVSPVFAEGEAEGSRLFESQRYSVRMTAPEGWSKVLEEPVPVGRWVDLVRYKEEKTGATLQLSVQATTYRSSEGMINGLSEQFQKAASLAVLRQEVQAATPRRPKGILFEYSQRGSSGHEHKIAAYWYLDGRRYRIYGTVKEVGWKVAGPDFEACVKSVAFTTRVFGRTAQNFTDVEKNFAIYFADGWTLKLPGSGPRIEFESTRLGAAVRIWVVKSSGDLTSAAATVRREIERQKDVDGLEEKPARKNPDAGFDFVTFDYKRTIDGKSYLFRESVAFHGGMIYRIALGAGESTFVAAKEVYERMVGSLAFIR